MYHTDMHLLNLFGTSLVILLSFEFLLTGFYIFHSQVYMYFIKYCLFMIFMNSSKTNEKFIYIHTYIGSLSFNFFVVQCSIRRSRAPYILR